MTASGGEGGSVGRLRVGVVGIGSHCRRNILPALGHVPVELVAFCDVDVAAAAGVAGRYGVAGVYGELGEMLGRERLDAVFLVVGPRQHPALARQALDAGVHVWMEKPPGIRASDVTAIRAAAGDRVVVVGFKKVFMPAIRKVVELFGSDGAGPIRSMAGVYPLSLPADGAKALSEGLGSGWLANGCHPLSAMGAVGGPIVALTMHRAALGGGVCVLEFASGCVASLHLADGASSSQPVERYEFFGNNCHAAIENGLRVTFQRGIPFRYGQTTSYAPPGLEHGGLVWEPQNMLATLENQPLFTQGLVGSIEHFCGCVLDQRAPTLATLDFAFNLMHAYEAGLLSEGQRVQIPTEPG